MANELKMATVQSILSLHAKRWSQRRIARELGIHRETVARHLRRAAEAAQTEQPDGRCADGLAGPKPANAPIEPSPKPAEAPIGRDGPPSGEVTGAVAGRQSDCEPWRDVILQKSAQGLSARRIHQDLIADFGVRISYDSVRRLLRKLGASRPLPFRRIERAPGDECQVDFGKGAPVVMPGGRRRRPHLFRVVLSHSRKAYSEASWRQTTEDFIRCLENAFWHFGGCPKVLVIDNLRAAVKHPDWFDPELTPKLEAFSRHYGVVILPTKPYTPRHKGKVERGVDYAQENGLKGHVFPSIEAQNGHLLQWEETVADPRIHGTTKRLVGKTFQEVERPALQPLPRERFPFFHEGRRIVSRDGHVEVAKAYYSAPPEYLGRTVWVRWDARLVRLFNHRFEQIALHTRKEPGRFSTLSQHIPAEKISGVERGAAWLLGKVRLIGPETTRWAETMLANRGIEGVRVLQGLVSLAHRHRCDALEKACETAFSHRAFRLRVLRQLLKRHGAQQRQFDFADEHPIIRPLADYTAFVAAAVRKNAAGASPRGGDGLGFRRHGWANESRQSERVHKKSPGGQDRRGLRVIHPPRSGYPSSGCSPAEPDSVSPDVQG